MSDPLSDMFNRPEPNLIGVVMQCQKCGNRIFEAYQDHDNYCVRYWCDACGFESILEDVIFE